MATTHSASASSKSQPRFKIHNITSPSDLEATIALFTEYRDWLGIDLTFQGFEEEMASMPGKYSPSAGGSLLLARSTANDEPLGCVALRAMPRSHESEDALFCEMKRMFVAPAGRRCGLGRALAVAVIDKAAKMGYQEIRLDTLPTMGAAVALYESLGFRQIDAYYNTPILGTIFLSKDLTDI